MPIKEDEQLKNKTIKGFLWLLSGSGVQSVLQFIVLIVLARLLDPKSFGISSAALVVVSFTIILSTLGLGPALVQKKEIDYRDIGTSYTVSLILGLLFATIVFLISPQIAIFFGIEQLRIILKVMSIALVIQGLSIVSESLIQRELLFHLTVRIQVISYLAYAIVGVSLAILNFGVWSLVIAYLSQITIKSILSMIFQPYKIRFSFDGDSFRKLLYFSGGYSIAKISSEFSLQGDNFIVGKFLGAESLGLYSRAYQLMVMPANLIGTILERVLFPVMSKLQDSKEKLSYVYNEGIRITTTLMFPSSLFLFLNAENIILLLFGKQWMGLLGPFQILSLSLLFRASYKISDSLAKAKGAVYYRAIVKWIYAFMVVIFTFIGQFYGLIGVAIGVSVAIILNYILMTLLAVNLTGLRFKQLVNSHAGGLIIALIFWICSIPVKHLMFYYVDYFLIELFLFILLFLLINVTCIFISPFLFLGDNGGNFIGKIKKKMFKADKVKS